MDTNLDSEKLTSAITEEEYISFFTENGIFWNSNCFPGKEAQKRIDYHNNLKKLSLEFTTAYYQNEPDKIKKILEYRSNMLVESKKQKFGLEDTKGIKSLNEKIFEVDGIIFALIIPLMFSTNNVLNNNIRTWMYSEAIVFLAGIGLSIFTIVFSNIAKSANRIGWLNILVFAFSMGWLFIIIIGIGY